jgi:hypothetical protein
VKHEGKDSGLPLRQDPYKAPAPHSFSASALSLLPSTLRDLPFAEIDGLNAVARKEQLQSPRCKHP